MRTTDPNQNNRKVQTHTVTCTSLNFIREKNFFKEFYLQLGVIHTPHPKFSEGAYANNLPKWGVRLITLEFCYRELGAIIIRSWYYICETPHPPFSMLRVDIWNCQMGPLQLSADWSQSLPSILVGLAKQIKESKATIGNQLDFGRKHQFKYGRRSIIYMGIGHVG